VSSRASNFVRILFAVGLTAYLLYRSHPREVAASLRGVSWAWIGAAIVLVLLDRALMALRWIWLLGPVKPEQRPPVAALMRIFFVSTFVGSFLPQSVGSDAVRTWQVTDQGMPGAQALASVLMDRVLGIASILIAAIGGVALFPELLQRRAVVLAFAASLGGCLIALAFVFSARWDALVRRQLLPRLPARVQPLVDRILTALQAYQAHHGTTLAVLLASVGVQILRIVQAWCLGMSLGMTTSLVAYFAYIPVILLVMLLPISISGIGVSQGAFVWLFAGNGGTDAMVFALSVLFVALGIVGNLPGALLFLTGARSGARVADRG
jgi:glycosyltransferase 2 family protein